LEYFNEHSVAPDQGVFSHDAQSHKRGRKSAQYLRREIAFVLSLYFCYVIRMGNMDKRD
jgi:hypothetical protein